MRGKIVTDRDNVQFDLMPVQAKGKTLTLIPAVPQINCTGFPTIAGKKVGLSTDASAFVCQFTYVTPAYSTPGSGVILITKATTAPYLTSPSPTQVLIDTPPFTASVVFEAPAQNPATGLPDPDLEPVPITGTFIVQNAFVSA
ncbi:hypothetical protein [Trinickia sp.]|uniref:hypothetical protein n=1 Tax=Trinickia sp. TaxID=2571163 RepID=UPI003F7E3F8E